MSKVIKSELDLARAHRVRRGNFRDTWGFVLTLSPSSPATLSYFFLSSQLSGILYFVCFAVVVVLLFCFVCLFSQDSSCHSKLLAIPEFKLLAPGEPFNSEPSRDPVFPLQTGGGERKSLADPCQHLGLMLQSTEPQHMLGMQMGA